MNIIKVWILLNLCCFISEKNNLSFIETSALDSTNVETAFQNILTGFKMRLVYKNFLQKMKIYFMLYGIFYNNFV